MCEVDEIVLRLLSQCRSSFITIICFVFGASLLGFQLLKTLKHLLNLLLCKHFIRLNYYT